VNSGGEAGAGAPHAAPEGSGATVTSPGHPSAAERTATPKVPAGTWGAPSPIGYYAALQSAGGIAAPLLAGFSFTMTSVLLTNPDVCRWQNVTLALFVSAGILLIFAVQTSLWLQSHAVKPSDYKEWYPDKVVEGYPDADAFDWHTKNVAKAEAFAKATRRLYNLGILLLLAAVTTAVLPPSAVTTPRYVVVGVAAVGFVAELVWVFKSRIKSG